MTEIFESLLFITNKDRLVINQIDKYTGRVKEVYTLYGEKRSYNSRDAHEFINLAKFIISIDYNHIMLSKKEYDECLRRLRGYINDIYDYAGSEGDSHAKQ